MQVNINEKTGAIKGNVYAKENYDQGDGLYHFNEEAILTLWENGGVRGAIYSRMGKEPNTPKEADPRRGLQDGEKPIAKFE